MNFDLKQYRWKNRLLVVMTNSKDNETYKKFIHDYERHGPEIIERKLIRKTIIKPKLKPNFIISLFTLDSKLYRKFTHFVKMTDLINIIDQMPLRRAELQKKQIIIRKV